MSIAHADPTAPGHDSPAQDAERLGPQPRSRRRSARRGATRAAGSPEAGAPQPDRGTEAAKRAQNLLELLATQLGRLETALGQRDFSSARVLASSIRTTLPGLRSSLEQAHRSPTTPPTASAGHAEEDAREGAHQAAEGSGQVAQEGAKEAAIVAALEAHAAELAPRLHDALARSPVEARGLGFDLLDPEAEEQLEAQWLATLDGGATTTRDSSSTKAFAGASAAASASSSSPPSSSFPAPSSSPLLASPAPPASASSSSAPAPASASASGRTVAPSHEGFEAAADRRISALVHAGQPLAAPAYLHFHMHELRGELGLFLATHLTSTGDPQVAFLAESGSSGDFVTQLLAELRPVDASACVTTLGGWLSPTQLYAIVDRNRAIFERPDPKSAAPIDYEHGPKGPAAWSPAVASALGAALLAQLTEALPRMSKRLVALSTAPAAASAHDGSDGSDGSDVATAPISAHALGATTLLEQQIARAFVGRRGKPTVEVVAVAPPQPTSSGRKARARKPSAQAARPTPAGVIAQWTTLQEKLTALAFMLAPLGLAAELVPAQIAHVARRIDLEQLEGRALQHRATAFTQQISLLTELTADINQLILTAPATSLSEKAHEASPPAAAATPDASPISSSFLDELRHHARAAGRSDAPEAARRQLDKASTTRRDAAFLELEALCGQLASRLEMAQQLAEHTRGRAGYSAQILGKSLQVRHSEALVELAAIRGAAIAGGPLDGQRLLQLTRRLESLRFEATLISNAGALGQMAQIFDELENDSWVMFTEQLVHTDSDRAHFGQDGGRIGRTEAIRRGAATLKGALGTLHSRWLKVERLAQSMEAAGLGAASKGPATGLVGNAAAATLEAEFASIRRLLATVGSDETVRAFLTEAHDTARSAQRRAMCVQIAAMIGVAVLSNGVATAVGGAVTGFGGGTLAVQLASLAAETVTFSGLSARLNGEAFGAELLTNFAGNLATFGAMRAVKNVVGASAVGKVLATGRSAGRGLYLAAKLTDFSASALTTAAVQFAQAEAISLARRGRVLSEDELLQTAVQGLAMVVGGAVVNSGMTSTMKGLEARFAGAANHLATSRRLDALARRLAHKGDPAHALELLGSLRQHLESVHHDWKALHDLTPAELHARGLSPAHTEQMLQASERNLATLDRLESGDLIARLGLSPIAAGRVYAGDATAIARVRTSYESQGYTVERRGDSGDYEVSKPGEQPLLLIERSAQSPEVKPGAKGKQGASNHKPPNEVVKLSLEKLQEFRITYGNHKDSTVSDYSYDAKTRTMSFEVESAGRRSRYEAPLPEPIMKLADWELPNRIIGDRTFKTLEAGERILRELSNGNLEVLRELGVQVPKDLDVRLANGLEFGLGELPNGDFVLIRGAKAHVDWGVLPGVLGKAHTHPPTKGNNLVGSEGRQEVPIDAFLTKSEEPSKDVLKILPSGSDITFTSSQGVQKHRVFTPFVVEDGFVRKPAFGTMGARLEFMIEASRQIGLNAGGTIHQATIVGTFAGKEILRVEAYGSLSFDGAVSSWLSTIPPPDMISNGK